MSARSEKNSGRSWPAPIGGVIEKVMQSLGMSRDFHGWQVVNNWPDIVGEQVARRCRPIRFAEGILYVAIDDPVWRQEMSMQIGEMLKAIRAVRYGRVVTRIQLVKGERKA